MSLRRIVNKIISKYGKEVIRKPRIETIENGEITYTYGDTELIRGWISQITGYKELWEAAGILVEADLVAQFSADTTIEIGDLVKVDNEWYEVVEKIKRSIGNTTHSIECLLRKRE